MSRAWQERRLVVAALAGGAPALALALVLLVRADDGAVGPRAVAGAVVVAAWLLGAAMVRHRVAFWLRTVTNLLAAVREGDFSFRVRGGRRDDAFGELVIELNQLAQGLRERRLGDVEASALLRKVMAEIDVAVFAFDEGRRLRLINRAGEQLLAGARRPLEGAMADTLGLAECLDGPASGTPALTLPGGSGRFELRRGTFRQEGRPLMLVVLSDVSRALRAEELTAWRRLIRVIGHELNNSLAPIKSIAGSLEKLVTRDPQPPDLAADMSNGLRIIGARAEALNRFMSDYARFAKMPPPTLAAVEVDPWVRRVTALERRLPVTVVTGPAVTIEADADQLDQALINLVRNAVDASLSSGGGVRVGWRLAGALEVWVEDDGPGLPDSPNVFVPFFTTKPGGSGIGLVLCRQVAENHDGTVTLANRADGPGCRAVLRLPSPAAHEGRVRASVSRRRSGSRPRWGCAGRRRRSGRPRCSRGRGRPARRTSVSCGRRW
jgi:two-component system, NtrC family, nitrogen regulation sensor histidine kinase NtrY